jgi:hypothetical protein
VAQRGLGHRRLLRQVVTPTGALFLVLFFLLVRLFLLFLIVRPFRLFLLVLAVCE